MEQRSHNGLKFNKNFENSKEIIDMLADEKFENLTEKFAEILDKDSLYNPTEEEKNKINSQHKQKLYKHNLVRLKTDDGLVCAFKYNLQDFGSRLRFIGSQGHLKETEADFFQMIFEQKVKLIVQVNQLKEGIDNFLVQYPDQNGKTINDKFVLERVNCFNFDSDTKKFKNLVYNLIVMNKNERNLGNNEPFSFSCFRLVPREGFKTLIDYRIVFHLHYKNWEDHRGARLEEVLELAKFINNFSTEMHYPQIVIHCKGGLGRTSTTIGFCYILENWHEIIKRIIESGAMHPDQLRNIIDSEAKRVVLMLKFSNLFTIKKTEQFRMLTDLISRLINAQSSPDISTDLLHSEELL